MELLPLWIVLVVVGMVVICWVSCVLEQKRKWSCLKKESWGLPSTSPQPTGLQGRYAELRQNRELAAQAEIELETLLNPHNRTGDPPEPQSTVDGWSLPDHNSVVTVSAPPVTQANTAARPSVLAPSVPIPFVPPPSYHQIETVNQRDSDLQSSQHTLVRSTSPPASATPDSSVLSSPYHQTTDHQRGRATQSTPAPSASATFYSSALSSPYHQETQRDRDQRLATLQSLVAHFEDRGNFASARVIARLIERSVQPSSPLHTGRTTSNHSRADDSTAMGDQRRPQTPSPRTGHTDVLTDTSQRSWRSYFNTADRLRDLTGNQGDIANEASVPSRRYQPRSQTPPPAYHLVEQTAVRITRADSLPSYDDFMATPHKYTS